MRRLDPVGWWRWGSGDGTVSGRGSGDGRGAWWWPGGEEGGAGVGLFKEGRVRWGRFEHILTQETDKWKVGFWIALSFILFYFILFYFISFFPF
jgi:hypothetical protein